MPQINPRETFFFLNGSQIINAPDYTYLGSTISSNGSFALSKQISIDKTRRSISKTKKYLEFYKLPVTTCNKLFDSLFRPILLYNSEIWSAYEKLNFDKWETDGVERLHTQFYKHYFAFGLNKRARNVASRNEAGRLSLKSTIYENILKFWIHLENQPENSIAFQCLQISKQLALSSTKPCFMSSVNEITRLFQTQNQQNIDTSNKDNYNKWLFEIKQNIEHQSQLHQIHLLKSNRKLVFMYYLKNEQECFIRFKATSAQRKWL
jgi:hypothetical protein